MVKIVNVRSPISSAQNEQFAVALCRVSTEDQFQKGLSIPEQRSRIEKWAETNGVKVLKWEEIHHSAYRGLDEDPRVMDLLKFARETPQVALFLVDEKSRFAGRKYLRVTWQEELRRAGVRVVGVSEPDYDRNSIHGIWLEGISETKDEARSIETAYHTTKGILFSGENAIGEIMFLCTACGSSINSNQAASVNYYACSTYANKGKIGCALGLHIRKADVESKVLKAISNHFTKAHVGKIVKDFNSALDDTQYDQDATEKHLLRSIEGIEKSMANIVKAIEHGSAAVPTLVKRLESLQEEYQALSEEKAKIKKDCPIIPRLSEETILAKVRMLKNVMDNTSLSNKDRRMIVRYFVRQLRFYPKTGEVEIFFWPNPGAEISRLRLINKGKVKKDDDSSFTVFDGAGGRERPETIKLNCKMK